MSTAIQDRRTAMKTVKTIQVKVITTRSHGLEVFRVYVNGTMLSEHLKLEAAQYKAKRIAQAWAKF